MSWPQTVLITGANRGIGLGFTAAYLRRGYHVIATCRHPDAADSLNALLQEYSSQLTIEKLDVTEPQHFSLLKTKYDSRPIDILINNAGIFPEDHDKAGIADSPYQQLLSAFATNAAGAFLSIQTFLDNLLLSENPKIINLSSQMGSLAHAKGFGYSYRMSKVALNMLTRSFAHENDRIITVSLRPGWVQTAMGGNNASISVTESVDKMISVIDNLKLTDSGSFLDNDNVPCEW
jgi:NAD(P)-dependent dehydrogenase (short-subunit alcohol dehydrogenase family)